MPEANKHAQSSSVLIRLAKEEDLPTLTQIYNYYIENAASTFDVNPYSVKERVPWFRQFSNTGPHRLLVAERAGAALGFASSSKYKDRHAYSTSIETSVYLAADCHGRGIGRQLYDTLFEALKGEDLHMAFAGVTQPNDSSMRLHRAVGFEETGVFREAGRKFGQYWDVVWLAKKLG